MEHHHHDSRQARARARVATREPIPATFVALLGGLLLLAGLLLL